MPSFLRFSKKCVFDPFVRIQVFLKSLWKMAWKVHFLSDLGKIKPRNEEKRCILGFERLTLGVWGHCGAQNMDFSSLKGAGQVTVTKEVWTYFTRQKPILVPDGPRPQRKTFLDIFWRVFIIMGFILPETDQKCTFYAIFESKFPKCLKNGHFLH